MSELWVTFLLHLLRAKKGLQSQPEHRVAMHRLDARAFGYR